MNDIDQAKCQDVKNFCGLLLIIGDSLTFSVKFVKDFPRFCQIFQRFGRFLQISRDFIGFMGIF